MCYPDDVKAAVMAALLTGQSAAIIAEEYKIPAGTVRAWAHRAREAVDTEPVATQKTEIGNKLLDYISASLDTLKKQVEVFGDTDWLKKQPASEVAVLHGVIADKAIRLLEALAERADGGEDTLDTAS